MSRLTITLLSVFLSVGYFMLLSWSGANFFSYAKQPVSLSLEKQPVKEVALGQPVTLEILGSGFDESTSVQMHMDVNNRSAVVGSFPVTDLVNDMLIVGNRLFLASMNSGMQVFDINNPLVPELIQTLQPRKTVMDVEQHGDKYILSCAAQGIYIYGETVKGRLKKISRLYLPGSALESRVVGDYLYVAAGRRGVLVYDLNNIEDGQPVNLIKTAGTVVGIESFEDYLYLSSGSSGLAVYQLVDPQKPQYVGTISGDSNVRGAKRYQSKLFLIERDKVSLYQLGQSALPQLLENEIFTGRPTRLQLIDKQIYITDRLSGVHCLLFTPHGKLNPIGFVDVGGNPRAIAGRGDYLYVASSKTGLQIVDRQLVLPRQSVMKASTDSWAYDLFVKDQWLLVADGPGGGQLRHLDQPDVVVSQLTDDDCRTLNVQDGLLYVAKKHTGVEVFDISDIENPKSLVVWPDLTHVKSLHRFDRYLLLTRGSKGLFLVDISNFNKSIILDSFLGIHAMSVEVDNGLIYVAGEKSGVSIFQVSEQGRLELVSKIIPPFPLDSFSAAQSLKVFEGIAYIANAQGGLLLADVRNPQKPVILSSIDLPGITTSLVVEGETVYVSSTYSGVHVIDVADVNKPRLLASLSSSGSNSALQVINGKMFFAKGNQGVLAYPIPQQIKDFEIVSESKLRLSLPSPNVPGRYSLRVSNREQSASLDGVVRFEAVQNL